MHKWLLLLLMTFSMSSLAQAYLCLQSDSLMAIEIELSHSMRRAAFFHKTKWIELDFDYSPRSGVYIFVGSDRSLDDILITFIKKELKATRSINGQIVSNFNCHLIELDDFVHL